MDTVLIVDDDPAVREVFTAFLELGGYTTLNAPGGRECLELLKTKIPDLILLDMMMEPMDGWETLLAIRNQPSCGQIPVIIITGKQPVPDDIALYGSLIEDFIVKPVEFQKTVSSLHMVIERARDLIRETSQKKLAGMDPAAVDEYASLLRFVRISNHLTRRFKELSWTDDRLGLDRQEERLESLHSMLGFPDHFLERSAVK